MKKALEKLKQKYNEIPVRGKRIIIISTVVAIILGLGFVKSGVDHSIRESKSRGEEQEVPLSREVLEKSFYMKALKEKESDEKQIKELERSLADLKNQIRSMQTRSMASDYGEQQKDTEKNENNDRTAVKTIIQKPEDINKQETRIRGTKKLDVPPPPLRNVASRRYENNKNLRNVLKKNDQYQQQKRGGIAIVSNPDTGKKEDKVDEDLKKKDKILLPPSFMEATLLSGVDAPTSESGKAHPAPLFFRVKAPAVLPNEVRANLKGCFLVGEGSGRLDTERVDVRLVNLSCVDMKGRGIVVSPVKGYIVDADSKIGLKGRVVSKMGSVLARHLLVGVLGGVADAAKSAGTTFSTTEFGLPVQSVEKNTEDALKSGLGTGISDSFKELQKFYLNLAKQTMPVVEVGALKQVVAVITMETTLDIKEF